jgi:PPOX class probable F420-dependent enzyme
MINDKVQAFISSHRVAVMATADARGAPHVVPICYAFDGDSIFTAIDLKPKQVAARSLKRLRNIESNPKVALVIHDYSEDWGRLAHVLVTGRAEIMANDGERERAEALLRDKYPQYVDLLPPGAPFLRVTVVKVVSWGAV